MRFFRPKSGQKSKIYFTHIIREISGHVNRFAPMSYINFLLLEILYKIFGKLLWTTFRRIQADFEISMKKLKIIRM